MYHNNTLLGSALAELSNRLTGELVLIPSAQHPGEKFAAVTNESIRQRNLLRWRAGRTRFLRRERRAA